MSQLTECPECTTLFAPDLPACPECQTPVDVRPEYATEEQDTEDVNLPDGSDAPRLPERDETDDESTQGD